MAPKSRKRIIITPTIVIDAAFTGAMRVAFTGVIAVATITDRGCDENGREDQQSDDRADTVVDVTLADEGLVVRLTDAVEDPSRGLPS